jgi:hypothetical protein
VCLSPHSVTEPFPTVTNVTNKMETYKNTVKLHCYRYGGNIMNKIYTYFCLLFMGSLLPFLIVEFYFQDYLTVGLITIFAIVILTVCVSIKYLYEKYMRRLDVQSKKINYLNWVQKKEKARSASSYYFRNRIH